MKDHRRCHCAPLVYLGFLFLGLIAPTLRIASAQAQQVFKTQSATIYYDDPASLREMEHRLRFSQANKFSQSYFYTQDPVQAAFSPGLAAKVDGLLAKVCLLLNKWPKKAQGLRIFLLKDGKQVQQRHLVFQTFSKWWSFIVRIWPSGSLLRAAHPQHLPVPRGSACRDSGP